MIASMTFIANREEHDVILVEKSLLMKKKSLIKRLCLLKTVLNSFLHYCHNKLGRWHFKHYSEYS